MGKMKNAYKILVGKPERKRLLRRHRHRWQNDIKVERKLGTKVCTRFIWLKIRYSGVLL
jgi:hypothetical protein